MEGDDGLLRATSEGHDEDGVRADDDRRQPPGVRRQERRRGGEGGGRRRHDHASPEVTARPIRRPRQRYVGRYLGGKLGRPTPWFDCTAALEWDPDPRGHVTRRAGTIVLVVSGTPSR